MADDKFDALFMENFHSAVFIAKAVVASREVAEDIVQEVFIKLLDVDLDSLKSPSRFLFASVRNAAVDYVRSKTLFLSELKTPHAVHEPLPIEVSEEEVERAQNVARLFHAIERLPEQSRKVVKLVCLKNYSYQAAATELGMSVATVNTHIYRSFKALRKYMAVFF